MNSPSSPEIQNIISGDAQTWRPLRHFSYFRVALALAFLAAFYNAVLGGFLGSNHPEAFLITNAIFLFSSLIYVVLCHRQVPSFQAQVIVTNTTDILLISLMMLHSGGLDSGLGMLLIINIVATGSFLRGRESFVFAALASVSILIIQSFEFLHGISKASDYSKAGILGIVFFTTSMLASILARRLRESEALADQRTADLLSLEKLNEHIIQNMRTGIMVITPEGRVRMANYSAETLLGNISLKEQPLLEEIFPALNTRFYEWLAQPRMYHKPIRQKQGLPDIQPGFRKLDESSSMPDDTLVFLEDATQLNQRFQQMKLASLGRLTASIAHEIRNPLSAINHAAQLLDESELNTADKKLTQIINTQVQRLDKIVKNVLQLSRQEENTIETIDLKSWLEQFRDEFCNSMPINKAQIIISIEPENISIQFDSSHLYQVLNNLCSNAISHSNKPVDQVIIKLLGGLDLKQGQPYLNIIDNGSGINPELAEQIFEPFFTTDSKGTGLGLFISKEIIENNRARIRYIDQNGDGSCFRIHFLQVIENKSVI
ncbi:MAG TPA: ATP-binding protein [Gammaproteobacteria bacterium]